MGYLLKKGADAFAETEKGETCLHMAAKNAYTECLSEILSARVSIGGGPPTRLADVKLPYTPPVKFVDMRNGMLLSTHFTGARVTKGLPA